jgi:hypothetical protein
MHFCRAGVVVLSELVIETIDCHIIVMNGCGALALKSSASIVVLYKLR